jgi:hypothetical protein
LTREHDFSRDVSGDDRVPDVDVPFPAQPGAVQRSGNVVRQLGDGLMFAEVADQLLGNDSAVLIDDSRGLTARARARMAESAMFDTSLIDVVRDRPVLSAPVDPVRLAGLDQPNTNSPSCN